MMVHWYVLFGHPLFLFPDGFQYPACFDVLVGGNLRTWPQISPFFFNIVDLIGSAFALLKNSLLVR